MRVAPKALLAQYEAIEALEAPTDGVSVATSKAFAAAQLKELGIDVGAFETASRSERLVLLERAVERQPTADEAAWFGARQRTTGPGAAPWYSTFDVAAFLAQYDAVRALGEATPALYARGQLQELGLDVAQFDAASPAERRSSLDAAIARAAEAVEWGTTTTPLQRTPITRWYDTLDVAQLAASYDGFVRVAPKTPTPLEYANGQLKELGIDVDVFKAATVPARQALLEQAIASMPE